jgi:hypothetical protein
MRMGKVEVVSGQWQERIGKGTTKGTKDTKGRQGGKYNTNEWLPPSILRLSSSSLVFLVSLVVPFTTDH